MIRRFCDPWFLQEYSAIFIFWLSIWSNLILARVFNLCFVSGWLIDVIYTLFIGVSDVKADSSSNKLTVTGKVDPAVIKAKLEQKTKKKTEIVSPQPKKDGGGDKKPDEKAATKPDEKAEKKTEEKGEKKADEKSDKKTDEKTEKKAEEKKPEEKKAEEKKADDKKAKEVKPEIFNQSDGWEQLAAGACKTHASLFFELS